MVFSKTRITVPSALLMLVACIVSYAGVPTPAVESNVANTKHNFAANWGAEAEAYAGSDTRTVKANSESQICVFCHTPHAATDGVAPLWNRALSTAPYAANLYDSDSMDATVSDPSGKSKLCLSCHDGTLAIGAVNVINGSTDRVTDPVSGLDGVTMPTGTDGYTRNLGTDLTNDHPISFSYDDTLASADGELYPPSTTQDGGVTRIAEKAPSNSPVVPLENVDSTLRNQVQCTSCHDPHIWDKSGTQNLKFLRLNRFQLTSEPADGSFIKSDDIICLACHSKDGWSGSVHASQTVGNELYTNGAADEREFPRGIAVWEAACLNCHDTHTVTGANRLQRGGVSGGTAATEETCYQCHDGSGNVVPSTVANIKGDFALLRHMPITNSEQGTTEGAAHAIGTGTSTDEGDQRGKDFIEDNDTAAAMPGLARRHAECTDCHNPHRMMRNAQFDGGGISTQGTHLHDSGTMHTNEASGVLSGSWGVEPSYNANCGTSANWGSCNPVSDISYEVRRDTHDNGNLNSPVDKEYQVCLKCHSSYAYGSTPPNLGVTGGGTPSNTNGVTQYTDQAKELQGTGFTEGSAIHTGFHPIRTPTLRTAANRGNMTPANFLAPWNDSSGTNIGNQTMYCSDCHGSDTATGTSEPTGTNPWGPHGSSNDFILKGPWDTNAGGTRTADDICFKCHDWGQYADPAAATINRSGFSCSDGACTTGGAGGGGAGCRFPTQYAPNLHLGHAQRIGSMRCTWCHAAVPHGWKNKALLVDITNDTFADTGNNCAGAENCYANQYYQGAYLGGNTGGVNWKASGNWTAADCGGAAGGWMAQANGGCSAPQ